MNDDKNPYAAPASDGREGSPAETPRGLGNWLIGVLAIQLLANLYMAQRYFSGAMRAIEPNAPAWCFPARGALALVVAGACGGLLAKRRLAWYAYVVVFACAIPLNFARGGNPFGAVFFPAAAVLLVWLLLRKRMSVLR